MVNKKKWWLVGIITVVLALGIFLIFHFSEKESFSVNPSLSLGVKILLLEQTSETIKITNNENLEQSFSLSLNNFQNIASLSEDSFTLGAKESKEIEILFKDIENKVGVYPGKLVIQTANLKKELPILLTVMNKNRIFTVDHDGIPEYSDVHPNGKLGVRVQIFDMDGNNLREIKVVYSIKDFNDELILSDETDLTVEGSKEVKKIIDIPETMAYGNYVFVTTINYNDVESIEGYLFAITPKQTGFKTFSDYFNFFVISILILIVVIVALFFYFIKTRDALLIQLKKQQSQELRRNLKLITDSQKALKKIKPVKDKEKKIKKIEKIKKKVYEHVKKKQKKQEVELKKLKKRGKKKSDIEEKLSQWKKQGYNMFETEKEIKKASGGVINKQINEWKKQGYDTSALRKQI